jgi:hypothetical protein
MIDSLRLFRLLILVDPCLSLLAALAGITISRVKETWFDAVTMQHRTAQRRTAPIRGTANKRLFSTGISQRLADQGGQYRREPVSTARLVLGGKCSSG